MSERITTFHPGQKCIAVMLDTFGEPTRAAVVVEKVANRFGEQQVKFKWGYGWMKASQIEAYPDEAASPVG